MISNTNVCRTYAEILVVLSPTRVRKFVQDWMLEITTASNFHIFSYRSKNINLIDW